MTAFEKILVAADRNPTSAAYRAAMGFFFIPVLSKLHLDTRSVPTLLVALLVMLFAYRVALLVMRRVLKFSSEANAVWGERREIAKRFDCYQWQKLLFVGIGIACYILLSREFVTARVVIAGLCVVGGFGGIARWMSVSPTVREGLVNKYAL